MGLVEISWSKLDALPDKDAVVRLLMCANDVTFLFFVEKLLRGQAAPLNLDSELVDGGWGYIMRLACNHTLSFAELLKEVTTVGKPAYSAKLTGRIDADTKVSECRNRLLDATNSKEHFLNLFRNRGTFHYFDYRYNELRSLINQAIGDLNTHNAPSGRIISSDLVMRMSFLDKVFNHVFYSHILPLDNNKKPDKNLEDLTAKLTGAVNDVAEILGIVRKHYLDDLKTNLYILNS